jgi:hypothetical protein
MHVSIVALIASPVLLFVIAFLFIGAIPRARDIVECFLPAYWCNILVFIYSTVCLLCLNTYNINHGDFLSDRLFCKKVK